MFRMRPLDGNGKFPLDWGITIRSIWCKWHFRFATCVSLGARYRTVHLCQRTRRIRTRYDKTLLIIRGDKIRWLIMREAVHRFMLWSTPLELLIERESMSTWTAEWAFRKYNSLVLLFICIGRFSFFRETIEQKSDPESEMMRFTRIFTLQIYTFAPASIIRINSKNFLIFFDASLYSFALYILVCLI